MCERKQNIYLIGIGMGKAEGLTEQAAEAVKQCRCLIGAGRILDAVQKIQESERKNLFQAYLPDEIFSYIRTRKERENVGVLFSGDTGFYSGAKKLTELLCTEKDRYDIRLVPGISSVSYLAAELNTSWEDAAIVSLHGRKENFIQTVSSSGKTFLLLGGENTGNSVVRKLKEYGLDNVTVYMGTRLSYPDEKILSGRPSELEKEDIHGLCTVLIRNPNPVNRAAPHIRDEEFIRGKVPMTKEEVRAVSIARMRLSDDAVVYDIGAGTGSVSVEAARCGSRIRVYAVEKNPDAVKLLEQNRKKFCADGIRIIEGTAPEILEGLEPPSHIFIGGSQGRLGEILAAAVKKNPMARIVINAVSLEKVKEIIEAEKDGLLPHMEITQMCVSRSKKMSGYHMMTGLNPVYIISAGGDVKRDEEI